MVLHSSYHANSVAKYGQHEILICVDSVNPLSGWRKLLPWSTRNRRLLSIYLISMDKWAHVFSFCCFIFLCTKRNLYYYACGCGSSNFESWICDPLIEAEKEAMAAAIARSYSFQPRSLFNSNTIYNPSPYGGYSWLGPAASRAGTTPRCRQICAAMQPRPTWLPGLDPPAYLDGTWALRPPCKFLLYSTSASAGFSFKF